MKRWQWALGGVLVGVLEASACNGGGTQPPGPPADVVVSGGNGQSGYFNNPLPTPLSVTVLDLSGRPVPGVVVSWTLTSGDSSGAVNPVQSTTNVNGVASTNDSIGHVTIQRVSAAVTGVPSPASFTEFATTPPPTVVRSARYAVAPGDSPASAEARRASEATAHRVLRTRVQTIFPIGSFLTRFPVAAKMALHTAGATGPTDGSPMPPCLSSLGTT